MFRRGSRTGASRIPLQGAERSQAKVGRKGFRQSRFFRGVRQEKDQRDSQTAWLRYGGVSNRDQRWTSEAQSEGESLAAALLHPVPPARYSRTTTSKLARS